MTWRLWKLRPRHGGMRGTPRGQSQHSFSKGANWFMSIKPDGPWKTADSVPKENYTIPSGSPAYSVT
jgi:hypothetical protein